MLDGKVEGVEFSRNKGTLVLNQLSIGWSFLKKRQMGIYLKCFRSHVPLFCSITDLSKYK
jgi:hypothetical protein